MSGKRRALEVLAPGAVESCAEPGGGGEALFFFEAMQPGREADEQDRRA